jgi:hypothetical protein
LVTIRVSRYLSCKKLWSNFLDLPGPALISSTSEHNSARGPIPTRSPAPPQPISKPDYSAFSAFGSSHPVSQSTTPQPSLFQQQQALQTQKQAAPPRQPVVDPFAALSSPIRTSTPQQAKPSIFDFASHQAPAPAPVSNADDDDDDWAFSSALPESGLPSEKDILILQSKLKILLSASRDPQNPSVITMRIIFSSETDQPISELTFAAAVTKVSSHSILIAYLANEH